jgi:hypothetical protein
MSIARTAVHGLVAGLAGTAVLDTVTYLDVAVRGRATSSVPSESVAVLARRFGLPLKRAGEDDQTAENRRSGLGALLGYLTGFSAGVAFGVARRGPARNVRRSLAGAGLGLAVMASTDASYTSLGVSDPRTWSGADWLSDLVPHLCYGWAVAAVFDALSHD